MSTEKYLEIDMDRWPDAWAAIKEKLKAPETHYESGWLSDLFDWIDSDDPDASSLSYEISAMYTISGVPTHVDIPVKWTT